MEPKPTRCRMSDPPPTLLDVPDDALLLIATHDLPSALSLRSTCDSLHVRLLEVGKKIADQRKADAGRSRAEMSLVAMSNKSEIDRAAERAMALGMTVPPPTARSDHMIGKHKNSNLFRRRRRLKWVRTATIIPSTESLCTYCTPGVRVAEESGVTEDDLQVIAAELLAKGIHVSIRGTAIRISPNVYVLLSI